VGAMQYKSVDADIPCLDGDIRLVCPVTGKVSLLRTDAGILVRGAVQTEVELACSRCLVGFVQQVIARIEEEFTASGQFATDRRETGEPADPALLIDELHTLDLGEVIRQQLLLALPSRPLCREDCAGLCPQCGQDINQGPCGCVKEPDPRWDGLHDLLQAARAKEGVE